MTAHEFLQVLFAGCSGFLELRHLPSGGPPAQQFGALDDDLTGLCRWGTDLGVNVYFGVYPRTRKEGTADAVAPQVSWVFCDLDGDGRPMPQALAPTIVVDSGSPGHKHCYWRLTNLVAVAHAEKVNRALARALGGDPKATDRARVLRLPGTVNSKTNRQAVVMHHDLAATYSVEDFASIMLDEEVSRSPDREEDGASAVVALMLPYWQYGERHVLALALSGYLAKVGWPWPSVHSVLENLIRQSGDEEGQDRLRACQGTFRRLREGKPVEGFVGLRELPIPAQVLEHLEEQARRAVIPPDMRQIDQLRQAEGMPSFLRRRAIAHSVIARLKEDGRFLRCTVDRLYWFDNGRHLVLPLETAEMKALLDTHFGLNASEGETRYVCAALESEAIEHGEAADVYLSVAWRADAGQLHIDAGGGRVYRLDGERIEQSNNGDNGIFFRREPWQVPVVADLFNPLDPHQHLVRDLNFACGEGVSLAPDEQAEVFYLWIRSLFFVEEQPTRPILVLVGDPGSGKTSAQRRIQVFRDGPLSNVHQVTKEDAFEATLCASHLVVLDNIDHLDRRTDWLEAALCRAATGAAIKKRELYTTNREVTFFPRAFVAITTKGIPFSDGPLGDRLLILRLSRREQYIPEGELLRRVLRARAGIWGGLLVQLNHDVSALRSQPESPTVSFRLADWAGLTLRIAPESGRLFPRLQDEQAAAILAHSPLPAVVELWLEGGGGGCWLTARQLYHEWQQIAATLNEDIGSSPRSLAKQLGNYWQALTRVLPCQRKDGGNRGYLYRFEKRAKGDIGDTT